MAIMARELLSGQNEIKEKNVTEPDVFRTGTIAFMAL